MALAPGRAASLDLFARHQVSVEFATADGKPLADAEVRVFAPGKPNSPALTGRTDSSGKFEFPADEDGFWTAEARGADNEIARVAVRVGGPGQQHEPMSPVWLIGGLLLGFLSRSACGSLIPAVAARAEIVRRSSRGFRR